MADDKSPILQYALIALIVIGILFAILIHGPIDSGNKNYSGQRNQQKKKKKPSFRSPKELQKNIGTTEIERMHQDIDTMIDQESNRLNIKTPDIPDIQLK